MRNLALAVVLLATPLAGAGERDLEPLPPPPNVSPEQIVAPSPDFRLSSEVLFVIDVSGSMESELRQAIDSALMILGSPVDDFRAGILAFSGEQIRWAGTPGCRGPDEFCLPPGCSRRCVPMGWAEMPTSYREALDWLSALVADGTTNPGAALLLALKEPSETLTVVLVTDGVFHTGLALDAVERGQDWRTNNGLLPAPIMVWGAGAKARDRESLKRLAEVGGGGLWVHGESRSGPW